MKYTDEQLNDAVKNNIFTNGQIEQFREYEHEKTLDIYDSISYTVSYEGDCNNCG